MTPHAPLPAPRRRGDAFFLLLLAAIGGAYVVLILALLAADIAFLFRPSPGAEANPLLRAGLRFVRPLGTPEIQHAVWLTLISCTLSAILSVWVAVPLGYLMSRYDFPGKRWADALLDIPVVLPPLVVGISLLILFRWAPLEAVERVVPFTHAKPGVVLAQFAVAAAFAVRTMRVSFDGISPRQEQVALTLGASRAQAFWRVVLPAARRGVVTAWALAWARSLGEFGPILVFAGTTPRRTVVLSASVYLEQQSGDLEASVAVALLMVVAAAVVLVIVRVYGMESPAAKA
jgi:molybdate transport system permease protein